jgi:hypothetical protein
LEGSLSRQLEDKMHSYIIRRSLLFLIILSAHAFIPLTIQGYWINSDVVYTKSFMARLYDDPLPPRRSSPAASTPKNKQGSQESDDDLDEDEDDYQTEGEDDFNKDRLFQFDATGAEVNGLLPNLGRSLSSNIPCYFEASDRKVINLVGKALCHVDDACWALEACKGDILEAWTCISMARRLQYTKMTNDPLVSTGALDKDVYDLEREEEFEEQKEERQRIQRKQDRDDMFRGGTPDQNVWPNFKPGPDESEPWFTG